MDPLASALQLALAQTGKNRQEMQSMSERNDKVGQQVMQAAQVFNSMSERAASREQQDRQFNVLQAMREQEMGLKRQETMASLAQRNASIETQRMQYKVAEQQFDQVPMQQAANIYVNEAYGKVLEMNLPPDQSQKELSRLLNQNTDVSKVLTPIQFSGLIDKIGLDAAQTEYGKAQLAFQKKDVELQTKLLKYAPDPKAFLVAETGELDRASAIEFVAQEEAKERAKLAEEERIAKRNILTDQMDIYQKSGMSRSGVVQGAKGDAEDTIRKKEAATLALRYREAAMAAMANSPERTRLERIATQLEQEAGIGDGTGQATGTPTDDYLARLQQTLNK